VHEEGREDRGEAEPDRPLAVRHRQQRAPGARKEREVGDDADQAQLGRDRQRGRVRVVAARGEIGRGLFPACLRLRADADSDEGVVAEDLPRHRHEAGAIAR
jgi:hypothetical protein